MLRRGGLRLVTLRVLALFALALLGCDLGHETSSDSDTAPADALLAAEQLHRSGDIASAGAAYAELLARHPDSWEAARGLQDSRRALMPVTEFEAQYVAGQAQAPDDALAVYLLGRARIQRPAEAREAFERAAGLAPQNPWPAVGIAYLHSASGDIYLCVEAYEEAIERMPRSARLRRLLGNQLLNLKLVVDAQRHLEISHKLQPRDPKTTGALGKVYVELGRQEQGRALLEESFVLDPTMADVTMSLAGVYLYDREPERAEEMYRLAVEGGLPPDEALYGAIRAAKLVELSRRGEQ